MVIQEILLRTDDIYKVLGRLANLTKEELKRKVEQKLWQSHWLCQCKDGVERRQFTGNRTKTSGLFPCTVFKYLFCSFFSANWVKSRAILLSLLLTLFHPGEENTQPQVMAKNSKSHFCLSNFPLADLGGEYLFSVWSPISLFLPSWLAQDVRRCG